MEYFPVAEDIKPELAELAVTEDVSGVAQRLGIAKDKLERLITRDPEAIDLIAAARAEYEAFLRLRALLMGADALVVMEKAMREKLDEKKGTMALRAAESILDRTSMPKLRQQAIVERQADEGRLLPDLNKMIERSEDDQEALAMVSRYRQIMQQVDDLRQGVKETIDGELVQKDG